MTQKSNPHAGKNSSRWLEPLDEYFDSLAEEVRRLAADGKRRLLVTSSGAGEGKSTITAGLGRAETLGWRAHRADRRDACEESLVAGTRPPTAS